MMERPSTCERVDAGLGGRCLSIAPQASSMRCQRWMLGRRSETGLESGGIVRAVVGDRTENE